MYQFAESGDWSADNRTGGELFELIRNVSRDDGNPCSFASFVRELVSGGQWGAVQVGFFFAMAAELGIS